MTTTNLRTLTLEDIRELRPCYDPSRYAPEDWQGTVIDILKAEAIPAKDRVWVAAQLIDPKTARLFAARCARQALALVATPDPRSVAAVDVAERYANGEATLAELASAWASAWAASRDAVMDAEVAAAMVAADSASWAATRDAVWAAWAASRDAQVKRLIEMLEAEE